VPDDTPTIAPRSGVAIADFELLRVARTDVEASETVVRTGVGERLRSLVSRPTLGRTPAVVSSPVRRSPGRA
jgi:hypothetical protein